ncbi:MAG: hypothetical protein ACO3UU_01360 [Minisyncoccia bacterium]
MRYHKLVVIMILITVTQVLNFSISKAQELDAVNDIQPNTNSPESLIKRDPSTQEEANIAIDSIIKNSFADSYYTDKASVGEIKLVIKNKYLFTKQKIDFATINYHIDKNFRFEGAEYTWRIKKGNEVVIEVKGINKSNFFFNFIESGTYQIEVAINSAGVIKTGSISLDIYNKLSLDYRPLNPGKSDIITVATELPLEQYVIEWKLDGETFEKNNNKITFTENKGYKQSYFVEAIARDRFSGYIKYYGNTTIVIKEPEIRVSLVDNKNNSPIEFSDEININDPMQLLISSDAVNYSQNAKLEYIYRVNDRVQDGTGNSLTLDIDPNQSYKIDIVVRDTNQKDASIVKSFIINKDKVVTPIDANLAKTSVFDYFKNDRYLALGVLSIMGVMLVVMSSHSQLNKVTNK